MKKHRLCLITVAMMAAGCTTYQHPEPTQAKHALKQAMNDQQKQAAPLTALPGAQPANRHRAAPCQAGRPCVRINSSTS